MAITLDHTIVHASDPSLTAEFLTRILGLPEPRRLGHFVVVEVGPTSLDLLASRDPITPRHFAFLVSEEEFDEILARLVSEAVPFRADPFHREPNAINRWDDGRGVYFDDPNGHVLEVLTRRYGSGGLDAEHVNPLIAQ